MVLSVDDIVKKDFSRSLMGYDTEEVDVFLDAIIERIERMETERAELMTAMEKLLKRVERMEKAGDGEKRALESGEKQSRKHIASGVSAAGPMHVQGSVTRAEVATADNQTSRTAQEAPKPQQKRPVETLRTEAPAHSRPIRPAAKPFNAAQNPVKTTAAVQPLHTSEPITAPSVPETPHHDATAYAVKTNVPEQSVAIEMESGAFAPDAEQMLPELINDIENAILDGNIRSASHKDVPVRATDQSRVS